MEPKTEEPEIKSLETPTAMRPFIYLLSGGFGGTCSLVVGHPMDTVKFRLQTMPNVKPPLYSGTIDCIKKIFEREGIRGLFRGMGLQMYSTPPVYGVSFFGYGLGKSIQVHLGVYPSNARRINFFLSGALSGVFTTFLNAPAERIKVLIQKQSAEQTEHPYIYRTKCGPHYSGGIDVIVKLYRKDGIKSLFKGTLMTFIRDVPAYGTYFMTYESLKIIMSNEDDIVPFQPYKAIIAGGLAGMAHWCVAMPPDIMKSRLQTAPEGAYPQGLRDVFRDIYINEGIQSFYKGIVPVMIRAFPANAACFIGFEYSKSILNKFVK